MNGKLSLVLAILVFTAGCLSSTPENVHTITKLTSNEFDDGLPAWSLDGTQIAFSSNRNGNNDIFTMHADGSNVRQITSSKANEDLPVWSSDGHSILYTSNESGNLDLYVIDLETSQTTQLLAWPSNEQATAWAVTDNGEEILFFSDKESLKPSDKDFLSVSISRFDYYVAPVEAGVINEGQIRKGLSRTYFQDSTGFAKHAPTGTQVAYVKIGQTADLYVKNGTDQEQGTLIKGNIILDLPTWSPDGEKIAVVIPAVPDYPQASLAIIDLETDLMRRVTFNEKFYDTNPAWSPDGKQIAFSSNRDGDNEIYLLALDE